MNFSSEWDGRYKASTHLSIWPWSDLVGYVMRYARPSGTGYRVLELGCGAGANIPFFQALNVEYCGIEGSPTIVEALKQRLPALKDSIVAADFTLDIPFSGNFDLVVDRSSLTHNTTAAIMQCLDMVATRLKPGGMFIGIDWFSKAYSEFPNGKDGGDNYTRTDYCLGPFANVGRVHFSDRAHLTELFSKFDLIVLEHKQIKREIPDDGWEFASWNFVAKLR